MLSSIHQKKFTEFANETSNVDCLLLFKEQLLKEPEEGGPNTKNLEDSQDQADKGEEFICIQVLLFE